jgi:hypothetical protein
MVTAALGMIPAIGGALLQEAIDLAVILNALRASAGAEVKETPTGNPHRPDRRDYPASLPFAYSASHNSGARPTEVLR